MINLPGLNFSPDLFQLFLCVRDELNEIFKCLASVIIAMGTILHLFFHSAFSDSAGFAMAEKLLAAGLAADTVDVFSFEVKAELFVPFLSNVFSQHVIISLSGDIRRAFVTHQAAIGYHFRHGLPLFLVLLNRNLHGSLHHSWSARQVASMQSPPMSQDGYAYQDTFSV